MARAIGAAGATVAVNDLDAGRGRAHACQREDVGGRAVANTR